MNARFKLKTEDILEKQFHVDFKGYSAQEVDEYLDLIIQDYEEYNKMIKELGDRLAEFEQKTIELKQQISTLEAKETVEAENSNSDLIQNLDVLKRISRLEEAVFKK